VRRAGLAVLLAFTLPSPASAQPEAAHLFTLAQAVARARTASFDVRIAQADAAVAAADAAG
jgi:hypothetical protein